MMLVGRLMVEGLVKDHTIAMLTHRIGELEMDLQKLRIGVTE